MGEVKVQRHIVGPTSYRLTSLSFHIRLSPASFQYISYLFRASRSNHSYVMTNSTFYQKLKKKKNSKTFVKNRSWFLPNSPKWEAWLGGYGYRVWPWLDECFSTFSEDKITFLALRWQLDLEPRSPTWPLKILFEWNSFKGFPLNWRAIHPRRRWNRTTTGHPWWHSPHQHQHATFHTFLAFSFKPQFHWASFFGHQRQKLGQCCPE